MTQHSFTQTTRHIKITVTPDFLESQSIPSNNFYVWSYDVAIFNLGTTTIQLLTREWKIIDANGQHDIVRGEGVIGMQPFIYPGENFEYASGTHLFTPYGVMMGRYTVEDHYGEIFDLTIPTFSLNCKYNKALLH